MSNTLRKHAHTSTINKQTYKTHLHSGAIGCCYMHNIVACKTVLRDRWQWWLWWLSTGSLSSALAAAAFVLHAAAFVRGHNIAADIIISDGEATHHGAKLHDGRVDGPVLDGRTHPGHDGSLHEVKNEYA